MYCDFTRCLKYTQLAIKGKLRVEVSFMSNSHGTLIAGSDIKK